MNEKSKMSKGDVVFLQHLSSLFKKEIVFDFLLHLQEGNFMSTQELATEVFYANDEEYSSTETLSSNLKRNLKFWIEYGFIDRIPEKAYTEYKLTDPGFNFVSSLMDFSDSVRPLFQQWSDNRIVIVNLVLDLSSDLQAKLEARMHNEEYEVSLNPSYSDDISSTLTVKYFIKDTNDLQEAGNLVRINWEKEYRAKFEKCIITYLLDTPGIDSDLHEEIRSACILILKEDLDWRVA